MSLSVGTRNLKFMQRAAAKQGGPAAEELPRGVIQVEEDAKWVMPSRKAAQPATGSGKPNVKQAASSQASSSEAGPSRLGGGVQVTWESSYMPFLSGPHNAGSRVAAEDEDDDADEDEDVDMEAESAGAPSRSWGGGGRMRFGFGPTPEEVEAEASDQTKQEEGSSRRADERSAPRRDASSTSGRPDAEGNVRWDIGEGRVSRNVSILCALHVSMADLVKPADLSARRTEKGRQHHELNITPSGFAKPPSSHMDSAAVSTPSDRSGSRGMFRPRGRPAAPDAPVKQESKPSFGSSAAGSSGANGSGSGSGGGEKKMTAAERMRATIAGNRSNGGGDIKPAVTTPAKSVAAPHQSAQSQGTTAAGPSNGEKKPKGKKRAASETGAAPGPPSTLPASSASAAPPNITPKKAKKAKLDLSGTTPVPDPASGSSKSKSSGSKPKTSDQSAGAAPPSVDAGPMDIDARARELKAARKKEKKAKRKLQEAGDAAS